MGVSATREGVARRLRAAEKGGMDDLALLRLQMEWGADEALADAPVDCRKQQRHQLEPAAPTLVKRAPSPAILQPGPGAVAQAQAAAAAAQTREALRAALAAFEGCALRATATRLVFSDGDPAKGVVLVTDVPGAAEDRAGVPFAGPAGLFLDRMFTSAGLDRAEFLATSLLPWRPPGDRKPADLEVQICLPFLLRHLELLQPRRIILFGALTARTLLPAAGRRTRGVWQDLAVPGLPAAVPTLALPSMAHIQSTAAAKRDAWADMLRLRRVLDELPRRERNDHD